MTTHCTGSTIHAGIRDTIIDVCLAVGSSPSRYTCTTVACNKILQTELHMIIYVSYLKVILVCFCLQTQVA